MTEKDEVVYYDVFDIANAADKVACVRKFVESGCREVDLDAYQIATRMWVGEGYDFTQSALKLVGEMGELLTASYEAREKEVGDVLWYLARIADWLQVPLSRFDQPNSPLTLLMEAKSETTVAVFVAASQISELAGKLRMHRKEMQATDNETVVTACTVIYRWLTLKYMRNLHQAAAANIHKLWKRHGAGVPNYTLPK